MHDTAIGEGATPSDPDTASPPRASQTDTILFIVNPSAGAARNINIDKFLSVGMAEVPYEILKPDSPEALSEQLPPMLKGESRYCKVVIVGGDGTIMHAIPTLQAFPDIPIGILPLGTGNLLAQNLHIPLDLDDALTVVRQGRLQPIDLCKMNEHYFVLNAGAGMDADIMANTEQNGKDIFGVWAYVLEGARHVLFPKSYKLHVVADGKRIKARGLGVICFNAGSQIGGGLSIVPNVSPDDGYLHGCIFRIQGIPSFFKGLWQVLQDRRGQRRDPVQHFKAKVITIDSKPRMTTQADGNVIGNTPIRLEVLPRQLLFLVP